MNKLMKKKKKGFTLIELIAVIAILAILAVVAVPRVIQYVDKAKRVAIQTQASTIYNAAEAAYNDGKLEISGQNVAQIKGKEGENVTATTIKNASEFDTLTVNSVVTALKNDNLLSNVDTSKFGQDNNLTLGSLKTIMNAKTDDINVDSQGVLTGINGQELKGSNASIGKNEIN